MAERTVKLAGITFREAKDTPLSTLDAKGKPTGFTATYGFGMRGQKVDVHDEDVERFDALNDQYDEPQLAEATGPEDNDERRLSEVVSDTSRTDHPLFPQGPDPLDHGLGGDLKRPDRRANVSEWRDYAERLGVEDVDEKTKRELVEETADLEEERAEEYRRAASGEGVDTEELGVDDREADGFEETR